MSSINLDWGIISFDKINQLWEIYNTNFNDPLYKCKILNAKSVLFVALASGGGIAIANDINISETN